MSQPNSMRVSDSSALKPQGPTPARAAVNAILSILAWVLFFYWWSVVAGGTTRGSVQDAVVVLVLFLIATLAVTFIWVRHNLRIAKRGKRGLTNRYVVPVFRRDFLNRTLDLGPAHARRESRWLVVEADARSKRYRHQELFPFLSEGDAAFAYNRIGTD